MGLSLIAVGCGIIWYLWAVYQKASLMDAWVETPCTIEKSEVKADGLTQHYATKYKLVVEYTYTYQGQKYRGDKFKRLQPESPDKKKVARKQKGFAVGDSAVCYVNPDQPDIAVLKKDTKASIYTAWFPGLFVLGGVGMIVAIFWVPSRRRAS